MVLYAIASLAIPAVEIRPSHYKCSLENSGLAHVDAGQRSLPL